MPEPKNKDGFTMLPNEILNKLVLVRIPGQELRVALSVIRKTYGFHKTKDQISYGQISKITDIPRTKVIQHVNNLVSKRILCRRQTGTRKPPVIWVNDDCSQWRPNPKKGTNPLIGTNPHNGTIDSPREGATGSPHVGTHKINVKKNITKEIISPEILEFTSQAIESISNHMGNLAPKKSDSLLKNSANTIDKLIRIDGFDLGYIKSVLEWAMNDDFWKKNALSLSSLRNKSKSNGLTKFQNMANSYEQSKTGFTEGKNFSDKNKLAIKNFLNRRLSKNE